MCVCVCVCACKNSSFSFVYLISHVCPVWYLLTPVTKIFRLLFLLLLALHSLVQLQVLASDLDFKSLNYNCKVTLCPSFNQCAIQEKLAYFQMI